jgi:hypothetical protein
VSGEALARATETPHRSHTRPAAVWSPLCGEAGATRTLGLRHLRARQPIGERHSSTTGNAMHPSGRCCCGCRRLRPVRDFSMLCESRTKGDGERGEEGNRFASEGSPFASRAHLLLQIGGDVGDSRRASAAVEAHTYSTPFPSGVKFSAGVSSPSPPLALCGERTRVVNAARLLTARNQPIARHIFSIQFGAEVAWQRRGCALATTSDHTNSTQSKTQHAPPAFHPPRSCRGAWQTETARRMR